MMNKTVSFILALAILVSFCALPYHGAYAEEAGGSRIIVSLGDSYSSGEGIQPYFDWDQPDQVKENSPDWVAHRSLKAWSGMLELPAVGKMSDHWMYNWLFAAASGATTADLKGKQHKEINRSTKHGYDLQPQLDVFGNLGEGQSADYVTITIGGNDAGFTSIVSNAALHCSYLNPNSLSDKIFNVWIEFDKQDGIRDHLRQAYQDTADRAGDQAAILVVGYPGLLSMDGDGQGLVFDQNESRFIDSQVTKFNNEIRMLVSDCYMDGLNIYFVSVEEAFFGHEAYTEEPFINEVSFVMPFVTVTEEINRNNPVSAASLHPNEEGARAYAACVQEAIDYLEERKGTELERTAYSEDYDAYQQQVIENAQRLLEEELPELYKDIYTYAEYLNRKQEYYIKTFYDAEMYQREYNFGIEWSARWIGLLSSILIGDLKGEFAAATESGLVEELKTGVSTVSDAYISTAISEVCKEFSVLQPDDLIPAVSVNAANSISIKALYDINDRMVDGKFASFEDAAEFIRIHQMNKACLAAAEMGASYYRDSLNKGYLDHFMNITKEFLVKQLGGVASRALLSETMARLTAKAAYRIGATAFHEIFDMIGQKYDNQYVKEWVKQLYAIEEETKQLFLRSYNPAAVSPWEEDHAGSRFPEGEGKILAVRYRVIGNKYYRDEGSSYIRCVPSQVDLDFIDPDTGEKTHFRTFSTADTHSCTIYNGFFNTNTHGYYMNFNDDMTVMTATIYTADGEQHVGWVDLNGAFTDVSALITTRSDFGTMVNHCHPAIYQNYYYFRDLSNTDGALKRVPLDNLIPSEVETLVNKTTWNGTYTYPKPDGSIEDGGQTDYYDESMTQGASLGYCYDWINPNAWVGSYSSSMTGNYAMIYRYYLDGNPNEYPYYDTREALVPTIKGRHNYSPVVSADGSKVAFLSQLDNGETGLFTVSSVGGEPKKVPTDYDIPFMEHIGMGSERIMLLDWN